MEAYPLDEFRREVEQIELREPDDLLRLIPLAARLAALTENEQGTVRDDSQLSRWRQFAGECKADLARLLAERTQEGVWDLQYAIGEDLALAVIDAQDFYCFYELEKGLLTPAAQASLETWFQEAEEAPLDEESVESLHVFIERFPIPEKYRLGVVHAPVSTFMRAVLATDVEPLPIVPAVWVRPAWMAPETAEVELAELLLCSTPQPTDKEKEAMHREATAEDVPGIGKVRITRRLDDDWSVVIDVETEEENIPPPVRFVRMGLLPAIPSAPDRYDQWVVKGLKHTASAERPRAMCQPVVISFRHGVRVKVVDERAKFPNR